MLRRLQRDVKRRDEQIVTDDVVTFRFVTFSAHWSFFRANACSPHTDTSAE